MTMLTKARQRVDSVARTSTDTALRLKAEGRLHQAMSPDMAGGFFGRWREETKSRERFAQFRGVLYAAVNALALHGAGQPVIVGRQKKRRRKPGGRKDYRPNAKKILGRKDADEIEVIEDHPLCDVLENPNPFQKRWQFVYSFMANINLTGRSYLVSDQVEDRLELYSLPTTWVTPVAGADGTLSGWRVGDPGMPTSTHIIFEPEQIAYAYLPHPGDPRLAYAPAESQMPAIRVDDKIWSSREMFFDNGIFPGCIVTVGQNPHPEAGQQSGRPLLTGDQRKQVYASIKRLMSGVANYGNPAIVDGLIENIERLQMSAEEMGWEKSAAETKMAILSAFAVHPYILGEHMPGSMAQARIIKELFYERVNMFLDMLGNTMTEFVQALLGEEGLYVWWETKVFSDAEMRWRQMMDMRRTGDVSQSELRAEVGLTADEDETPDLISTHGKDILQLLAQKGQGAVTVDQGVAFVTGLGIPKDLAEQIVGKLEEEPVEDGTAPTEQAKQRSALLNMAGGISGSLQIFENLSQGSITRNTAVGLLVLFFGITKEEAEKLVGEVEQPVEAPGTLPGAAPGPGGVGAGPNEAGQQGPPGDVTGGDLAKAIRTLREVPLDVSRSVAKRIVEEAKSRED